MPTARQILDLIGRSGAEVAARHLPSPQPRSLLEPMSREDYSRELNQGEGALNRCLKKLPEEYLM